ncbi:MAG TPA: PQQ-binding-like beta-propeller repeat protein [Polyangiaceae bacterium]
MRFWSQRAAPIRLGLCSRIMTDMPAPVLVSAFNGRVFGLDVETGATLWEQEIPSNGNGAIALQVTATAVYAAASGTLMAFRYPTGEKLWSADTADYGATLLVEGDKILVGAAAGEIACFTTTGERLWNNGFKGKGQGPVALATPNGAVQADSKR